MPVPVRQRLMQDLDDWMALKDFTFETQAQNFWLKTFMSRLLQGQPHHDHLQASTSPPRMKPVALVTALLSIVCATPKKSVNVRRHCRANLLSWMQVIVLP